MPHSGLDRKQKLSTQFAFTSDLLEIIDLQPNLTKNLAHLWQNS